MLQAPFVFRPWKHSWLNEPLNLLPKSAAAPWRESMNFGGCFSSWGSRFLSSKRCNADLHGTEAVQVHECHFVLWPEVCVWHQSRLAIAVGGKIRGLPPPLALPAITRDEDFQPDFHDILGQDIKACSSFPVMFRQISPSNQRDKKMWSQGEEPIAF